MGGPDNVGLSKCHAAEDLGQDRTARLARAAAKCPHVGNPHRRNALIGHAVGRAVAVGEDAAHAIALRAAELAMHVVEFDTKDDVVPLAVVADEAAEAVAVNRYFSADGPPPHLARTFNARIGKQGPPDT